ncbi:MAG: rhamnan synthesis F family protein [Pseudomonadota bacterium]
MKRPELWKIRRELWRIRDQFVRKVLPVTIEPVQHMIYYWRADKAVVRQTTDRPLGARVAILVLFQPKGLLASTFLTVDHLVSQGWSVLVVSNAPLSYKDQSVLAKRASIILQRPNLGYDFGAYREGFLHLDSINHKPQHLIFMNDSTWFPIRENDNTLARMEALNVGMAGHIYKVESTVKRGNDHLESHLVMFNEEAVGNPAFISFWQNYRMSNDRTTTIARGEKALTQMALSSGLKVQGLLSVDAILNILSNLPDDVLRSAIINIVHHQDDARALCAKIIENADQGKPWRDEFLAWVRVVLSNSLQHLLSATFIDLAMVHGSMGFVKKTNDPRFHMAQRAVLRAADSGRIPPLHPVVRSEIERAVDMWIPPHDWRKKPHEIRRYDI